MLIDVSGNISITELEYLGLGLASWDSVET